MRTLQPEIAALPELLESAKAGRGPQRPGNAPITTVATESVLREFTKNRAEPSLAPEAAVTALFDRYRGPLFRFLLSLGLSAADVEETIQEVFLALFKHLRAGKPRDNLRGWLFQSAHNQALKLRQRRPAPALIPPPSRTPEQQAIANQTRRRVAAVIQALPGQDRACIALRSEGLRYREIAEILGISLGGVALSLGRALARISHVHQE
ncbi:MAG: RNA polymerase sigma factor [Bryobacteraceae bacterium]